MPGSKDSDPSDDLPKIDPSAVRPEAPAESDVMADPSSESTDGKEEKPVPAYQIKNQQRSDREREELFADLYSANQHRVYGYIVALLRNTTDAQDVLQQTASVLWRKFDLFDPETEFFRWAAVVARFEALNFIKYRRRSRLYFSDDLMETLAEEKEEILEEEVSRRDALADCIKKLPHRDRQLIERRYNHGLGSRELAEVSGRSASSICNSLRRIRAALMACIEASVAQEDHA